MRSGGAVVNGSGYVPKRRGVLDHLQDGRLTLLEYGAYDAMILLADKASGIWFGSAKALAANCGGGDVTERRARQILEALESKGYIKRFAVRRSHRNYPILIDKYQVTFGAYKGMRLNAAATKNWRTPLYERCQEQGAEQGVQLCAERAPYREGNGNGDLKRSAPTQTSPSPEGFDGFWQVYPRKVAKPAAVSAWRKINPDELPAILRGIQAWKQTEQWSRDGGRFIPYPATFLNQRRWEELPTSHDQEISQPRSGAGDDPLRRGEIPEWGAGARA